MDSVLVRCALLTQARCDSYVPRLARLNAREPKQAARGISFQVQGYVCNVNERNGKGHVKGRVVAEAERERFDIDRTFFLPQPTEWQRPPIESKSTLHAVAPLWRCRRIMNTCPMCRACDA